MSTAVVLQHAVLGMSNNGSNNVPDSVMKLIHDDLQAEVIRVFFLVFMLVEIFSVLTYENFL